MDPISLSASIAGLIIFVKEARELSSKIYDTVKSKPDLVKKIADDLTALEPILERLGTSQEECEEQYSLLEVVPACKRVTIEISEVLTALQNGFLKSTLLRVFSYSTFKKNMMKLVELRTELAAFKLTLGLALQMRVIEQIPQSASTILKEISKIRLELKKIPFSPETFHIHQYLSVSSSLLRPQIQPSPNTGQQCAPSSSLSSTLLASLTEDITNQNQSEQGPEEENEVDVLSFESFDAWLASFGQPVNTLSPLSSVTSQVNEDRGTQSTNPSGGAPILSLKNIKLNVKNLQGLDSTSGDALPQEQHIQLAPLDPLWKAIQAVQDKGYYDVCGFRYQDRFLAPIGPLDSAVPLYISDGPSKYNVKQGLQINSKQPLEQFYELLSRSGKPKQRPRITTSGGRIIVDDEEADDPLQISLNRTLRVPEDGTTYNLPIWTGEFPMVQVAAMKNKLPGVMNEKGGLLVPMYQREALSIGFPRPGDPPSFAVKILSGGVNSNAGCKERENGYSFVQDYVIAPIQHRIDGFFPEAGLSIIRQFVSMPLGGGYSVEEQLTSKGNIGGIQIVVAPQFTQRGSFHKRAGREKIQEAEQLKSPVELGFSSSDCLLVSGKKITEDHHQPTRRDNILCIGESFSLKEWNGAIRKLVTKKYPDSERPVLLHEAIGPFYAELDGLESIPLEPILKYTIKITTVHTAAFRPAQGYQYISSYPISFGFKPDSQHDTTPKTLTWRISPFMSNDHFFRLIMQELKYAEIALFYNDVQLRGLHKGDRETQHAYLYSLLSHEASVTCQGYEHLPGYRRIPQSADFRTKEEPKSWELGLAAGGAIFQDIIVDSRPELWNWAAASLFNIQIINSVAWKAITGREPPGIPPTFKHYLDARIPFYHIIEHQEVIANSALPHLKKISEIDKEVIVGTQDHLSGGLPVICKLCETTLADTIMRPCNHIFCRQCIDQYMIPSASLFCGACLRPVQSLMSFSAPMEAPSGSLNTAPSTVNTRKNMKQLDAKIASLTDKPCEPLGPNDPRKDIDNISPYWDDFVPPTTVQGCHERIRQWWQGSFTPCSLDEKIRQNLAALVFLTLSFLIRIKTDGTSKSTSHWLSYRMKMMETLLPELDFENITDECLHRFLKGSPKFDQEADEEGAIWNWNYEETQYELPQHHEKDAGAEATTYDSIHRRFGILLLQAAHELRDEHNFAVPANQHPFQELPTPQSWVSRMSRIYSNVVRLAKGPLLPSAVDPILKLAIEHEYFFILDIVIQSYEVPGVLTEILSKAIGSDPRKSHVRGYLVRRYSFTLPELSLQRAKPHSWAVIKSLYESLDEKYIEVDMTTNVAWEEGQRPFLQGKQEQWQKVTERQARHPRPFLYIE